MPDHTVDGLLNEIADLIAKRLPHIPLDDPGRPVIAKLSPALNHTLGRPQVTLVGGED